MGRITLNVLLLLLGVTVNAHAFGVQLAVGDGSTGGGSPPTPCSVGRSEAHNALATQGGGDISYWDVVTGNDCTVNQVCFHLQSYDDQINVAVYDGPTNTLLSDGQLTTATGGNQCVALDTPVLLVNGQNYKLVLGFKGTDTWYQIGFLDNETSDNYRIDTSHDVENSMPTNELDSNTTRFNDALRIYADNQGS